MSTKFAHIPFAAGEALLDWIELSDAMAVGHGLPRAEIEDSFLYRGKDTVLSRAAWIDGMGIAVKTATIMPDNGARDLPSIHGAFTLFDDITGEMEALVDFHLVTKWKTVGDSLLAARRLARPESERILIVGAGGVAAGVAAAFAAGFPQAKMSVWNRTVARAQELCANHPGLSMADDLETAVRAADIIVACTMSTEPVIKGEWLRAGQHLNLIGAYRPDMREANDEALRRARLFVDSFDTTIGHIGEIQIPLDAGVITRDDLLADYYDLDRFHTASPEEITLFKNGGGAHLDLMTGRYILDKWRAAQQGTG